jgi:hypothetical protein
MLSVGELNVVVLIEFLWRFVVIYINISSKRKFNGMTCQTLTVAGCNREFKEVQRN